MVIETQVKPSSLEQQLSTLLGIDLEEITNPERRQEFVSECERLWQRCGGDEMLFVFGLYLREELIEAGEIDVPGSSPEVPKMIKYGHKNTAVIIARFVKNGWMDYFQSPDDLSQEPNIRAYTDGSLEIIQRSGGSLTPSWRIKISKPPQGVREFTEAYRAELEATSELIGPDRIDEVFSQIDSSFESQPSPLRPID
jgi:hypothetical protein